MTVDKDKYGLDKLILIDRLIMTVDKDKYGLDKLILIGRLIMIVDKTNMDMASLSGLTDSL